MNKIDLRAAAADHILLAAHRGVCGGNIPGNTLESYEIALRHGADIVEVDVALTADNQLRVFHPGKEAHELKCTTPLKEMNDEDVSRLTYVNRDQTPTEYTISTFDDALEYLKGRCIILIDKFWTAMPQIAEAVRRHDLADQVIVKTAADIKWFRMIEEIAPEFNYMPIIKEKDVYTDILKKMNINYMGPELVFRTELSDIAQPEYVEKMHKDGYLLFSNGITYNYKVVLSAGHSDDYSLTRDPDLGWGWLVDRGYDIIQTDWTQSCRLYLKESSRYYKQK